MSTRFGIGYDAHPFEDGGRLVLAGVEVAFDRGLSGHSDGDVATHAIIDALLGAAALGDIGTRFPPDDPAMPEGDPSVPEGISSIVLLERTAALVRDAGWLIENVDATIVAERPHLAEHVTAMRSAIAAALGTDAGRVSIKATSEDGMGFSGSGEGISAIAVASITSAAGTSATGR
ncbi:MAG: 2-C-methyl-D-erythritol 2,4-cyclodiphosphate synthase [Chloroflexi bacterium]|nr:2-C-methyl-D-erythritol 2,4-cyclodiphosphate synthase [Chloroflexota bacterium]